MQASGFSVEDLVIDIYYWFDKSTKRKSCLSEYCNFCDINYRDVVKHVSTRWLSLERAIGRVLQQYDALRSYFLSEGISIMHTHCSGAIIVTYIDEAVPRFQRLSVVFSTPMTEIYLFFYQSALQLFVCFNKFLQREDPLISLLCQQIDSFLVKLASKFIPVTKIKAVNSVFPHLQYQGKENQLQGTAVSSYLQ